MATKTHDTHEEGSLGIVRHLSDQLIQARVTEENIREMLDRAIRDSATHGASTDALSEASGYDPESIRRISAESHLSDENCIAYAGMQ